MKITLTQNNIISWHNLENQISKGNSFKLLVQEPKLAWILFNSSTNELSLEIQVSNELVPSVIPQAIDLKIRHSKKDMRFLVLTSRIIDLRRYFYDFIVEVLELIQFSDIEPAIAVEEAWKRWGQLIEQQSILSREKQVGLLGEIWLLRRLAKTKHWKYAIAAWHRLPQAEHDFCLENVDIEVKSTATDKRIHSVGSLGQLEPSPGRPLYILSLQFAPSPSHANGAFSLTSSINTVLQEIDDGDSRQAFLQRLKLVGWHDDHTSYYKTSFIKRDDPYLIPVNNMCPRLVPPMLEKFLGPLSSRIESVMYSIDLSGLGHADKTQEFISILP